MHEPVRNDESSLASGGFRADSMPANRHVAAWAKVMDADRFDVA